MAESVLPEKLRRSDFSGAVDSNRRRELDRVANRDLLAPGILRVKLYAPDGTVVYSSDHQLIGTRPDDFEEIPAIMHGAPAGDVTKLNAEGGTGADKTVLESYVPIGVGGPRPTGVLELYNDYAARKRTHRPSTTATTTTTRLRASAWSRSAQGDRPRRAGRRIPTSVRSGYR